MNIQQLRYVVANANSGTFREGQRVCQSADDFVEIWKKNLDFKIFRRTSSGTFNSLRNGVL